MYTYTFRFVCKHIVVNTCYIFPEVWDLESKTETNVSTAKNDLQVQCLLLAIKYKTLVRVFSYRVRVW